MLKIVELNIPSLFKTAQKKRTELKRSSGWEKMRIEHDKKRRSGFYEF